MQKALTVGTSAVSQDVAPHGDTDVRRRADVRLRVALPQIARLVDTPADAAVALRHIVERYIAHRSPPPEVMAQRGAAMMSGLLGRAFAQEAMTQPLAGLARERLGRAALVFDVIVETLASARADRMSPDFQASRNCRAPRAPASPSVGTPAPAPPLLERRMVTLQGNVVDASRTPHLHAFACDSVGDYGETRWRNLEPALKTLACLLHDPSLARPVVEVLMAAGSADAPRLALAFAEMPFAAVHGVDQKVAALKILARVPATLLPTFTAALTAVDEDICDAGTVSETWSRLPASLLARVLRLAVQEQDPAGWAVQITLETALTPAVHQISVMAGLVHVGEMLASPPLSAISKLALLFKRVGCEQQEQAVNLIGAWSAYHPRSNILTIVELLCRFERDTRELLLDLSPSAPPMRAFLQIPPATAAQAADTLASLPKFAVRAWLHAWTEDTDALFRGLWNGVSKRVIIEMASSLAALSPRFRQHAIDSLSRLILADPDRPTSPAARANALIALTVVPHVPLREWMVTHLLAMNIGPAAAGNGFSDAVHMLAQADGEQRGYLSKCVRSLIYGGAEPGFAEEVLSALKHYDIGADAMPALMDYLRAEGLLHASPSARRAGFGPLLQKFRQGRRADILLGGGVHTSDMTGRLHAQIVGLLAATPKVGSGGVAKVVKQVGLAIDAMEQQADANSPDRHKRFGHKRSMFDEARFALAGRGGPYRCFAANTEDFALPDGKRVKLGTLLAHVWHAIEAYPRAAVCGARLDPLRVARDKLCLRHALVRALAECVEDNRRVCYAGKAARIMVPLEGWLQLRQDVDDPEEPAPVAAGDLLSELAREAFECLGDDDPSLAQVEMFAGKAAAQAEIRFWQPGAAGERKRFFEHLRVYIDQLCPAFTPAHAAFWAHAP